MTHWFDTGAFVVPAPGAFGNSGVNILEGPGLEMNNISLGKTFSFRERLRFTITAAATDCLQPCELLHSQLEYLGSDDSRRD